MNMISSCHSLTPHFKIVLSFEILIVQFITVTFRVHVNGHSRKLHTILCQGVQVFRLILNLIMFTYNKLRLS